MRELHSLAGGDGCPGLHSPGVSQLAGPQETLHQGRLRPELAGPGPGGVRQRGGAGDTEQEAGQSSSQAAIELPHHSPTTMGPTGCPDKKGHVDLRIILVALNRIEKENIPP